VTCAFVVIYFIIYVLQSTEWAARYTVGIALVNIILTVNCLSPPLCVNYIPISHE